VWVRRGVAKEGGREGGNDAAAAAARQTVWAIFAKRLITPGFHSTQSYTQTQAGRGAFEQCGCLSSSPRPIHGLLLLASSSPPSLSPSPCLKQAMPPPFSRFVFLGAPGVGKGTFASIIAPRLVRFLHLVSQKLSLSSLLTSPPPSLPPSLPSDLRTSASSPPATSCEKKPKETQISSLYSHKALWSPIQSSSLSLPRN